MIGGLHYNTAATQGEVAGRRALLYDVVRLPSKERRASCRRTILRSAATLFHTPRMSKIALTAKFSEILNVLHPFGRLGSCERFANVFTRKQFPHPRYPLHFTGIVRLAQYKLR